MIFAFSINSAFNLILDYFGGLNKMIILTEDKKWKLNVFLCAPFHCLPSKNTNKAWISNLWWGTYQCILIKVVVIMIQARVDFFTQ